MGNKAKDDDLYQEMCRVVGKVVLEMRDLGQEPKHIVIAGVLRTSLANRKIQRSPLTVEAMEKVIPALSGHSTLTPAGQEITKRITALTAMSQW